MWRVKPTSTGTGLILLLGQRVPGVPDCQPDYIAVHAETIKQQLLRGGVARVKREVQDDPRCRPDAREQNARLLLPNACCVGGGYSPWWRAACRPANSGSTARPQRMGPLQDGRLRSPDVQIDNDVVLPFYSWLAKMFTFCDHHFGLGTNSTILRC